MNVRSEQLIGLDKKYLWHPFTQMTGWLESEPVIIESGEGFYLIDTEGRRYIDGVSSLWCNIHGHRVKKIDDAIRDQLDRIAHSTLLGLGQSRSIELAEKLISIAPVGLEKVFYSDSGATAVEIAIKMAYQYWQNIGQKGRTKFIALKESYHGDTVGSVSVGGMELFHGSFKSLLFETFFVPSPHPYRYEGAAQECAGYNLAEMEMVIKENHGGIAAIIVEPLVQGAAGMLVHPHGFLKGVEQLARKYDVLLIVDEVATGFGRTGRMFACEHESVQPDIMCLAKGITGGYLPLAATLASEKVFNAFLAGMSEHKTFYHGHTYTGNALGCAAAIASLELFEENKIMESLPGKIEIVGQSLDKIKELDYVGDVRCRGLMGGIEIVRDKSAKKSFPYEAAVGAELCLAMRKRGAMMRPLGDVIVLMPPVGMGIELLEELVGIVHDAIRDELPGIVKGL